MATKRKSRTLGADEWPLDSDGWPKRIYDMTHAEQVHVAEMAAERFKPEEKAIGVGTVVQHTGREE